MSRQSRIEATLTAALAPAHLLVENESHNHSVKPGSETHFKVVVVSEAFTGKDRLARHRLLHKVLAEELAGGLHALTSSMFSPDEWASAPEVLASPACEGGSKRRPS